MTMTPLIRAQAAEGRCRRRAARAAARATLLTGTLAADYADLAADYQRTADEWLHLVRHLRAEHPTPDAVEETCCDGDHRPDEHDTIAALDDDASAYFARS